MLTAPTKTNTVSVNLLEHENTDDSVINRLINWAVTYGRYIMIATEIVVLVAFVSRFSLDRKLTDLREEIAQKEIILTANQQFEHDFRIIQKKLEANRALIKKQSLSSDVLLLLQSLIPENITLTDFSVTETKLTFGASSLSTSAFSKLLSVMTSRSEFTNVEMTEVKKTPTKGIEFRINAVILPDKFIVTL